MEENNKKKSNLSFVKIVKKLTWSFNTWIFMLLGKGKSKEEFVNKSSSQDKIIKTEDSVIKDINTAQKYLIKFKQSIVQKAGPLVRRFEDLSKNVINSSKFAGGRFTKLISRIILSLLVLILFFYVVKGFLVSKGKAGQGFPNSLNNQIPNLTAPLYKATSPSIYFDDKEIIALEENLKVLLKEIMSEKYIDDSIKPPILDMNISFKE